MKESVEKWRYLALHEISKLGVPLPVEHILAIMQRESNGKAGVVNQSSGASGLMQVKRIALKDYNQNHSVQYTMDQLRGTDQNSAAIQIRVGLWILSRFVKSAYKYLKGKLGTVPLDDLIRVSDTFYAAGPGNAKPKLDQLNRPTWAAIKQKFPDWDRVVPAELVWNIANEEGAIWDLPRIDNWLEEEITNETNKAVGGALIGILIILAAWMWFQKGGS